MVVSLYRSSSSKAMNFGLSSPVQVRKICWQPLDTFDLFNQLREVVLGARLDEELYVILQLEESRNVVSRVLIETYFTIASPNPVPRDFVE